MEKKKKKRGKPLKGLWLPHSCHSSPSVLIPFHFSSKCGKLTKGKHLTARLPRSTCLFRFSSSPLSILVTRSTLGCLSHSRTTVPRRQKNRMGPPIQTCSRAKEEIHVFFAFSKLSSPYAYCIDPHPISR